jgi:hypothetical protein
VAAYETYYARIGAYEGHIGETFAEARLTEDDAPTLITVEIRAKGLNIYLRILFLIERTMCLNNDWKVMAFPVPPGNWIGRGDPPRAHGAPQGQSRNGATRRRNGDPYFAPRPRRTPQEGA